MCIYKYGEKTYYTCVCKPHDIRFYSCIKNFKLFKTKVLKCLNVDEVPKNKKEIQSTAKSAFRLRDLLTKNHSFAFSCLCKNRVHVWSVWALTDYGRWMWTMLISFPFYIAALFGGLYIPFCAFTVTRRRTVRWAVAKKTVAFCVCLKSPFPWRLESKWARFFVLNSHSLLWIFAAAAVISEFGCQI